MLTFEASCKEKNQKLEIIQIKMGKSLQQTKLHILTSVKVQADLKDGDLYLMSYFSLLIISLQTKKNQ